MTIRLLRVAPYEQFGRLFEGKVHAIREGEQTFCGNTLQYTGGEIFDGARGAITCKTCLRSMDTRERRKEETEKHQEEYAQYCAEKERQQQEWWDWYTRYLKTPEWGRKRRLVLQRAQGTCEGCRSATPAHVHHLSYAHAGDELLYELVALCQACHQKVHPEKEIG